MATYYIKGSTSPVRLTDKEFVARGGEKSVYARGGTAYCVYHDRRDAIPAAKIAELAAIGHPSIVVPTAELMDGRRRRCGETMPFVDRSHSPANPNVKPLVLCQLFTNAFRRKHGVTDEHVVRITDAMLEAARACHAAGVVMVDPNEANWLVDRSLESVYLIDTACMQTRGFPGTAIKPAIRDHTRNGFDQSTDHFSLAVVLAWLWVGVHPYLAFHPDWKHMDANAAMRPRMERRCSFFRPGTEFNRACRPVEAIPDSLRMWLKAELENGARIQPPNICGEPLAVAAQVVAVLPSKAKADAVRLELILKAEADIVGVYGDEIIASHDPRGVVVFTPVLGKPVRVMSVDGTLSLTLATTGEPIPLSVKANAVFESGGRAYTVGDTEIGEIRFNEVNGGVRATVQRVGTVADLPTTRTWPGCVVQNLLGKYLVSVFPDSGLCLQYQLPGLEGWQILDAKYEKGVLGVCAESGGRYKMLACRFALGDQDCLPIADEVGDVNLAVTDRGVCAMLDPGGEMRLFSNRVGDVRMERLAFPAPDATLLSRGHKVVAAVGPRLYDIVF